jgi:hypothetical protein
VIRRNDRTILRLDFLEQDSTVVIADKLRAIAHISFRFNGQLSGSP